MNCKCICDGFCDLSLEAIPCGLSLWAFSKVDNDDNVDMIQCASSCHASRPPMCACNSLVSLTADHNVALISLTRLAFTTSPFLPTCCPLFSTTASTLQITSSPSSTHYPSRGHMDGPWTGSQAMRGKLQCRPPRDVLSSRQCAG